MAKADFTFRIRMDGNDAVVEAVQDTKRLRQEVDRAGKSYDRASKSATSFATTQARGVYGSANNARNFSKLSQTIGSGDNGLVGAYATLAANTFAVVAAFTALQRASNASKVMAGLEAQGARLGKTLSLTAENIREVTSDALSMADAMKQTAQLTAAGFDGSQIAELAQVAKDAAGALGRDLNDSMDRLTRGVTKLEPELLDEIGLMTKLDEASSNYAISINKTADSLTAAEKRQAFMNSVLDEGTRKFGGIGDKVEEYDAYTRLAAAGTDLFNSVVGTLAAGLAPIVEIFANNKLFLASAVVLYASSIKDDLLPALSKAAEKQQELALAKADFTKESAKAFAEQADGLSKVEVRDSNGSFTKNRSGSILKELLSDLEEGEVDAKRFESTLSSLNEEFDNNNRILTSGKEINEEYRDRLEAQVAIQADAISRTKNLASSFHEQNAAQHAANAVNQASQASFSNLKETIKGVTTSLKSQNAELIASNNYAISNLTGFDAVHAKFTKGMTRRFTILGTAARSFGAAFLNFLPVIGQVMFAIGLLTAAWSKLKDLLTTDEQKAYNKAQEEYSTILEESAKKQEEYNRLQREAVTSSQSQIDALKLRGNAVTELTAKLEELREKRIAAENSSIFDKLSNTKVTTDTGSASIQDALESQFVSLPFTQARADNEAYKGSLKGLSEVYGLVTDATKEQIDKEVERINNLSTAAEREKQAAKLISKTKENYENLALATENLNESFKNLEKSSTQFIQSLTISTPVDAILKDMYSVSSAIEGARIEMLKGNQTSEEYLNSLTDIGQNSSGLLGPLANELARLKVVRQELAKEDNNGARGLALAREQATIVSRLENNYQDIFETTVETYRTAQLQTRQLINQSDVMKATYSKVSDLFDEGAAGYLAQQAQAEKLRDIEVQKLEIQQNVMRGFVAQQEYGIILLRQQKALIEERLKTEKELTKEVRDRLDIEAKTLANNIKSAERAANELQDASDSIDVKQAAILAENLSEAEKAARAMAAELKVAVKFFEQINEYSDNVVKTNYLIDRYNRLILGTTNKIEDKVSSIRENHELSREALARQLITLEKEADTKLDILEAAQANNNLEKEYLDSLQRAADISRSTYDNEVKNTTILFKQLDIKTKIELLEAANFNLITDGIKVQQDSLKLLEKEAELTASNLDKRNSINASQRATARILAGIPDTEQSSRNEAVISATEALKAAKASAQLRLSVIDAEYALLEAERVLMKEELRSKYSLLRALGYSEKILGPLKNAYSIIDSIDVSAIRDIAVDGIKLEIRQSEQNLVEAVARATRPREADTSGGRLSAFLQDSRERDSSVKDAISELATGVSFASKIAEVMNPNMEKITSLGAEQLEASVAMQEPIISIKENVEKILKKMGGETPSTLGRPLDGDYRKSSSYGMRTHPITGERKMHTGDDYAAPTDTPIIATHDAIVKFSDTLGGYGKTIKLASGDLETLYAHASRLVVKAGEAVKKGQVIGYVGSTGNSTGPHLHYEVKVNGQRVDPSKPVSIPVSVEPSVGTTTQNVGSVSTSGLVEGAERILEANPSSIDWTKSYEVELENLSQAIVVAHANFTDFTTDLQASKSLEGLEGISYYFERFSKGFSLASEELMALSSRIGPDGEMIVAMQSGIASLSDNVSYAIDEMKKPLKDYETISEGIAQKTMAVGSVVTRVLQTIGKVSQASSDMRVRAIDQEIAAEQRRDGKSVESQKKIEALEKKKDQIKRKQFNTNKKLMMAEAVIATATGIAKALSMGPIVGPIMAAVIGAMGAAQLAIIAGTTYQGGSSSDVAKPQKSTLSIGKVGNAVNLDRTNTNAGGEIGYLRGTPGYGSTATNYKTVGSAYGGMTTRGYGHRSFLVGEKGPETIETSEPMKVNPKEDSLTKSGDTYQIHATDAQSFQKMLEESPEAIAKGLRKVANSSGKRFMEDVDFRSYGGTKA